MLVGLGALLITRIRLPARSPVAGTSRLRAEVVDGFGWVAHHAAVRTLVVTIFVFNVTFGAAWSELVLYAEERLHLGAIGFGLLTTASAVGGVAGTLGYGWLTRRVSLGNIMRAGLIIETFTHLSLAHTATPAVAIGIMIVQKMLPRRRRWCSDERQGVGDRRVRICGHAVDRSAAA